jgi:hypothetical protein
MKRFHSNATLKPHVFSTWPFAGLLHVLFVCAFRVRFLQALFRCFYMVFSDAPSACSFLMHILHALFSCFFSRSGAEGHPLRQQLYLGCFQLVRTKFQRVKSVSPRSGYKNRQNHVADLSPIFCSFVCSFAVVAEFSLFFSVSYRESFAVLGVVADSCINPRSLPL